LQGAALTIFGEQEFLADLKRGEGYTCEMLIVLNQMQRLAFFAVFYVAWFNADGRLGDRKERQKFGGRYP
jgi:hypothetical protein